MRTTIMAMLVFLLASHYSLLFSQNNPWTFVAETELQEKDDQRQIIPEKYKTLGLKHHNYELFE
ncbi:MAG: hypothetical protein R2825_05430 [Saprospiraceae bacterium]